MIRSILGEQALPSLLMTPSEKGLKYQHKLQRKSKPFGAGGQTTELPSLLLRIPGSR